MAPDTVHLSNPMPPPFGREPSTGPVPWPAAHEVLREREAIVRHLSFHALLSAMLTGMPAWAAAATSLVADGTVTAEEFFCEHPCTGGPHSLIDALIEHFEELQPEPSSVPPQPAGDELDLCWQFDSIVQLARASVSARADPSIRSAEDVRVRAYEVAHWAVSEVPVFEARGPRVPVPPDRRVRFERAEPLLACLLDAPDAPPPADVMRLVRALASYRPSGGQRCAGTAHGVGFLRQLPPSHEKTLAALEFCKDVVRLEIPEAQQLALLRGCIDAISSAVPALAGAPRRLAQAEFMQVSGGSAREASFSYRLDTQRWPAS